MSSPPLKILFRGTVQPADEVTQPRLAGKAQESIKLSMYGIFPGKSTAGPAEVGEASLPRNFSRSTQPLHEHEEDEVGSQEVNLKSPLTSNTIVNLKVSVCNASISNSLERGGHLTLGIPTGVGVPVDNDSILVNGRTSPQQTYQVTEVVTNETDATSIVTLAPDDSEHDLSLTMEESEYVRKCSSWFCRQGKSPFEAILLIFCYLMIVVLFFPIFVVIMLVCFVSYFTPDIDD